ADDRPRAQLLHRLQSMIAIGRPVLVVVMDEDDRIEKATDLLNHRHETFHVRLGWIALIRCRLDALDRHGHEHDARLTKRIAVLAENGAAVLLDAGRELA